HASLWRVEVAWPAPHIATVLLQLNQLLVDQHARHDRGTERLSLHRGICAGESENRRGHGGWTSPHCELQPLEELFDRIKPHTHPRTSRWALPVTPTPMACWRPPRTRPCWQRGAQRSRNNSASSWGAIPWPASICAAGEASTRRGYPQARSSSSVSSSV